MDCLHFFDESSVHNSKFFLKSYTVSQFCIPYGPFTISSATSPKMNNTYQQEMFYDHAGSRSPGSQRHQPQTVRHQSSRQFDAYGHMPNPLFNPEDQSHRFDTNRFGRMDAGISGTAFGSYDIGAAQTWNPTAFGGSAAFGAFGAGASRTMKPSTRGRANLPPVSLLYGTA